MNTDYLNAVTWLESLGVMPEKAPSLEPMRAGLEAIGFEAFEMDPAKVVVIAGTNGKGSTAATLEALLISAGARVGLYTSPHLIETTERYRIGGRDISQDLFVEACRAVQAKTRSVRLSHFEFLTLMAAWIFCSGKGVPKVEWLILEVGLGGLWDATNAIPHRNCVITTLGLDHQNFLGNTIESIARNKFGIIGENDHVWHLPFPEEIRAMAASTWTECERHFYRADPAGVPGQKPRFRVVTRWGEAELALPGARGAQNAALALTVFAGLGFDPSRHLEALSRVRWPGRMQGVSLKKRPDQVVYFSGDHNIQGIESLLELLPYYSRERLLVVFSAAKDKDFSEMLDKLAAIPNSSLYLTINPFRGGELSIYGRWLQTARAKCASPEDALAEAIRDAGENDLVLVTGSLYLVGYLYGKIIDLGW